MLRFIVIPLIGLGVGNCFQMGKVAANVTVSAESGKSGEQFLRVTITNSGLLRLVMNNAELPWRYTYSLILAAEGTQRFSKVIDKIYPIADPEAGVISLEPGQSVSGLVSLDRRFGSLSQALAREDVIIFWSYQIATINNTKSDRFGGWLLIAKVESGKSFK